MSSKIVQTAKGKERRKAKRIKHRMVARYNVDGRKAMGVVTNISEVGIFVQTTQLIKPGNSVSFEIGSTPPLVLEGKVMWSKTTTRMPGFESAGGMGISVSKASEDWQKLISRLSENLAGDARGIQERYEVRHVVKFQSTAEFLTDYTENLSHGGMYLATDQDLEPGATIRATIEIPGITESIEVIGRVAYRLNAKQVEEQGRQPGVGVQFLELSPEAKNQLDHYLKRLEIHRHSRTRRQERAVPSSGSLNDFLVPELLWGLLASEATGSLRLEHRGITKIIYFNKGQPIFVDSSIRSETLGAFLIRDGKLKTADLEASVQELANTDMRLGEILLKKGLVDGATLTNALVAHQEEKLIHTFPWFDGTFVFSTLSEWPTHISLFPLRPYQIVFEGIERWYSPSLLASWVGLSEDSVLHRLEKPFRDTSIPPRVFRLLQLTSKPRPLRELAETIKLPVTALFSTVFALILGGWVALDTPSSSTATATKHKEPVEKKPPMTVDQLERLKQRIASDFERLRNLDFYELLRVTTGVSDTELTQAFVKCSSQYSGVDFEQVKDPETRDKLSQIISWIRLAYDTLRDSNLRKVYARRGAKRSTGERRIEKLEAERFLLSGIRELESKNLGQAELLFSEGMRKFPTDSSLKGYLGWVLFQQDPKKNLKRSSELLDEALSKDQSDPQLLFVRGEIHTYLGNWAGAERYFNHAVRLHPLFTKAAAALEQVKGKRIAQERMARKA